jgi:trimeric autotransporter adhesin
VVISTLPVSGVLELVAGASTVGPITAGQVIAVADIPFLVYTPGLDGNGLAYSSFTFQVQDDGGTLFGGVDIDQTPNTVTFDVTSVNDAPQGADNTVTTLEDTDYVFSVADFGFTDMSDVPANNFASIIIDTLPANGSLFLAAGASVAGAVTAGQVISVADIPFLTFAPVPDANGFGYADFTFRVVDDGGVALGGADTDTAANTITIDVTAVDDAPILNINAGITILESGSGVITAAMLSSSDVDTPASQIVYTITNPTINGQIELTTSPGIAVTSFTQDDVNNGRVVYVHDGSETLSDSFDFTVADATTTLGVTAFSITVIPVSEAPYGSDTVLGMTEDIPYTFTAADFGFSDPDDTPSHNLQAVVITTVPANGVLSLAAGASVVGPVTAGQVISLADIPFLTYSSPLNANGVAYTNFTFQVQDDGGVANGGEDTDQSPNTITFDITAVDDAPVLDVNAPLAALEGFATTITALELSSSDVDTPTNQIVYTLTTLPVNGQLELTTNAGVAITSFTQADIDAGLVIYVHDSSETLSDSFDFTVNDATTTLAAGASVTGAVIAGQTISVADIPFLPHPYAGLA